MYTTEQWSFSTFVIVLNDALYVLIKCIRICISVLFYKSITHCKKTFIYKHYNFINEYTHFNNILFLLLEQSILLDFTPTIRK